MGGRADALGTAVAAMGRGDAQAALDMLLPLLDAEPHNADAWHLAGVAAHQLGKNELAADLVTAAIGFDGNQAGYHNNLGQIFRALGRTADARAALERAIALEPGHVRAFSNLAGLAGADGQFDAAVGYAERAVAAAPEDSEAYNALGNALRDIPRIDGAIAAYRKAIEITPDFALAHWNLSLALAMAGDFSKAFQEMAWRWRWPDFPATRRNFSQPVWDGEDISGKTLLVHSEQGLGDAIQFVRYAALAKDRAAKVIAEVPGVLAPLADGAGVADDVIANGQPLPNFDVHAPLVDLPRIFETTVETVPANVPYLRVPDAAFARWHGVLNATARLKVGLNWAGNPAYPLERFRRLPERGLEAWGTVPGIAWFALPRAPGEVKPPPPAGLDVTDTGESTLAEAAALIASLDLVITSDTAFAHLAGALGKLVWLALHHAPDWRWMLERADSPWYPTMRLFRQRTAGDWAPVAAQIAEALTSAARQYSSP